MAPLQNYLASHSYEINLSSDSIMPFFSNVMQNKKLFVYGEGGSHYLKLHDKMRAFLLQQFSVFQLRNFFFESSRTFAYNLNNAVLNTSDSIYITHSNKKIDLIEGRKISQNNIRFAYKGIDMEWGGEFFVAIRYLYNKMPDKTLLEKLPLLQSVLQDTTYLHLNDNNAWDNQKKFLSYYKKWKKQFYADSVLYKQHLGNQYEIFRYFITNPQIKPPLGNRNPGMAKNLLTEINQDIADNDTNAVYILDVGMAHSFPGAKGSMVGILSRTDQLKNKIVVMNVYCANCFTEKEEVRNWIFEKLIKPDIIECFTKAARTNLTLFDLSQLPAEYEYIKARGELLLFAKNQN